MATVSTARQTPTISANGQVNSVPSANVATTVATTPAAMIDVRVHGGGPAGCGIRLATSYSAGMATIISGIDELKAKSGQHLGWSGWHQVTQEEVNLFADATGDHQWIHVDVERAKAGPFGGPIAHGYLTLSLAVPLLGEVLRVEGVKMGVNYGLNRLRFPSPVPVGSKIRLGASVVEVQEFAGGAQATLALTFEVEGQEKPACVAEAIYRYYV